MFRILKDILCVRPAFIGDEGYFLQSVDTFSIFFLTIIQVSICFPIGDSRTLFAVPTFLKFFFDVRQFFPMIGSILLFLPLFFVQQPPVRNWLEIVLTAFVDCSVTIRILLVGLSPRVIQSTKYITTKKIPRPINVLISETQDKTYPDIFLRRNESLS